MESVFQAHLLPVGASPGLGRLAVARQMSLGVAETGVALTLLSILNHHLTKIQDGSGPHRCCRWHCFTNERLTKAASCLSGTLGADLGVGSEALGSRAP